MPWFATVRDWVLVTPQLNRIEREVLRMSAELDAFKLEWAEWKREILELVQSANKAIARIAELLTQIGSSTDPAEIAALTAEMVSERAKVDAAQQALEAAATPSA
jgi:chromosome segregation ATPase